MTDSNAVQIVLVAQIVGFIQLAEEHTCTTASFYMRCVMFSCLQLETDTTRFCQEACRLGPHLPCFASTHVIQHPQPRVACAYNFAGVSHQTQLLVAKS